MKLPASIRTVAALVLVSAFVLAAAGPFQALQHAATLALALWWDHLVPIMLVGYLMACLVLWLIPAPPAAVFILVAYLTFPPVAIMATLDHQRTVKGTNLEWAPLLLYTNFYNPLLFPAPRAMLALDAASLAAALLLHPSWQWSQVRVAPIPWRPHHWITEAFNWTSLTGVFVLLAVLLHESLPWLPLAWLLEPTGLHWRAPEPLGWMTAFRIMVGGLPYWAIILPRLPTPPSTWTTLAALRLSQALLAATLFTLYWHLSH